MVLLEEKKHIEEISRLPEVGKGRHLVILGLGVREIEMRYFP